MDLPSNSMALDPMNLEFYAAKFRALDFCTFEFGVPIGASWTALLEALEGRLNGLIECKLLRPVDSTE